MALWPIPARGFTDLTKARSYTLVFFVKTVKSPLSVVAEAGFEPTFPGHEPGELAVTPFYNIEAWPPMSSGDAVFISPSAGTKGINLYFYPAQV